MRPCIFLVLAAAVLSCALCVGCESVMERWEPMARVVYMPKKFEDGRIMCNPWREVKYGPSYPFALVYNPQTRQYEVYMREGATYVPGVKTTYERDADPYTMMVPARQ